MNTIFSMDVGRITKTTAKITAAKIACGSMLSILIAERIGLEYASSAGIITLLSIMNTRKETFQVAAKRCVAFLLAMLMASAIFSLLGYEVWAFGIFLLLFYLAVSALDVKEGFSMNAVLVTHLLAGGSLTWETVLNESGLFLIGVVTAILVNSYMPDRTLRIRDFQRRVENEMRVLLKELASVLNGEGKDALDEHILQTFGELSQMEKEAMEHVGNSFQKDDLYFVKYVEMRTNQVEVLGHISEELERLTAVTPQAEKMAVLFRHIGETFHETNNAQGLLSELQELRREYKQSRLPEGREEFENRAILFHILQLMEYFLKLKEKFADRMTDEERKRYWEVYSGK